MRVALYARVSTARQAQTQTIDQQLARLQAYIAQQGWTLEERHIYRDDGYSGTHLNRPGLDRLRDRATLAELDAVVITAPDRLARNYIHQVLLLEELHCAGCQVLFLERPMSQDPHDQLLLQIRGAVAEYERTLITERMRRGRVQKLRAGQLLPWITPPFGYRADPTRPRDPAGLQREATEAALVEQIFAWYREEPTSLYRVAQRLTEAAVVTPTGKVRWNASSVRKILQNAVYTGTAYGNTRQVAPARSRKSALQPLGSGESHVARPRAEWIAIPVPAIISQEVFDQVQAKLARNQQRAPRNNTAQEYLLRALVSCGQCQLSMTGRPAGGERAYYFCAGRTHVLRAAPSERCPARFVPVAVLDALVWADLCAVVQDPTQVTAALLRAQGGAWLPQELQARQLSLQAASEQLQRQQERLLAAYLAEVVELAEFERTRQEVSQRQASLREQQRQVAAAAQQHHELRGIAQGIEEFCRQVQAGLASASFAQRRALVELLIDRVIVTEGEVEIRYVIPTSPAGAQVRFCHLRLPYLDRIGENIA